MGVEKSINISQNPDTITLTVQDTGFLLALIGRASISGSELKQAVKTVQKFEKLHNFLVNKEQMVRGGHV